jgi:general secretion pathway protein E
MTVGSLEGFLLDRGHLTSAELSKAQQVCAETGERLVGAVRRLGLMTGNDLARAIAAYYGLPTVGEQDWPKATILSDVLSPRYLREHKVLPLAVDEQRLVLAAADPGHTAAIDAIQLAAGRKVELRVAPAEDIDAAIDRLRPAEEAPGAAELPAAGGGESDDDVEHLKDLALGAPVVRFVNQLLLDGLNARATESTSSRSAAA